MLRMQELRTLVSLTHRSNTMMIFKMWKLLNKLTLLFHPRTAWNQHLCLQLKQILILMDRKKRKIFNLPKMGTHYLGNCPSRDQRRKFIFKMPNLYCQTKNNWRNWFRLWSSCSILSWLPKWVQEKLLTTETRSLKAASRTRAEEGSPAKC